jgi:hypothetical protein
LPAPWARLCAHVVRHRPSGAKANDCLVHRDACRRDGTLHAVDSWEPSGFIRIGLARRGCPAHPHSSAENRHEDDKDGYRRKAGSHRARSSECALCNRSSSRGDGTAGITRVPVVLIRALSSLTRAEFWLTMENHRWMCPYDRDGRRVAFADMYEHVWELADDEFRSLFASVRDAGDMRRRPRRLKSSGGRIASGIACHPW